MKIGVISDTHNYLDPQIPALFKGVDHILHAGDIGLPFIILELEYVAPVTAVTGNTDEALDFRDTEVLQLAGRKFLLHHIINPQQLSDVAKRRIAREKPDVVVFGHSHKPHHEQIGRTLYFNPGYAGKPRFNQPRSIAILHCDESGIHPEYLPL
ncbi:MAG TPA: metallophosphoesterase family protein [Verrucomicrobiae bacterium]|nr:metallophosphoesterase family protein [Verrucomicrobiae bacterium]